MSTNDRADSAGDNELIVRFRQWCLQNPKRPHAEFFSEFELTDEQVEMLKKQFGESSQDVDITSRPTDRSKPGKHSDELSISTEAFVLP